MQESIFPRRRGGLDRPELSGARSARKLVQARAIGSSAIHYLDAFAAVEGNELKLIAAGVL
jgi:hypothetical protein